MTNLGEPVAEAATAAPVQTSIVQPLNYATVGATTDAQIGRRGDKIVTPLQAELPPVCIKSGTADDLVRIRTKISYVNPLYLLLVILGGLGLIILLVVYLATRRKVELVYYVERRFRTRRRRWLVAGLLMLVTPLVAAVVINKLNLTATGLSVEELVIASILISGTGLVISIFGGRLLSLTKAGTSRALWSGAREPFLQQLQTAAPGRL